MMLDVIAVMAVTALFAFIAMRIGYAIGYKDGERRYGSDDKMD